VRCSAALLWKGRARRRALEEEEEEKEEEEEAEAVEGVVTC